MRNGSKLYGALRHIFQLTAVIAFIAAMPAHAAQKQAAEKLVLAFGDSLTAGYGLQPNESFPAQLQAALRKQGMAVRVQNAGVSGDTSAQGRARLNWVLRALGRKPDLVIVQLGANDMLRGIDPAQTRANLSAILTDLRQQKVPVLLAGMLAAPNMGRAYRAQFDPLYPDLAKHYRVPLYPFFLNGVTGNRALLLKDNMHPTARGVAVVVHRITGAVKAGLQ